jgi:transglutaminase-like putative cysteine protease
VQLAAHVPDDAPKVEVPFGEVPADVLEFVNPSRYCQSDMVLRLAAKTFGHLPPGFERVPGTTDASSTAVDVLVAGAGVCRDYAHLAISLCRAIGVPARYVSGYAVDLDPPDFHGFFEAYLDGEWYLFDATRMAPIDGLVRIGVGRDAADVSFAASVGVATLDSQQISVIDLERTAPPDTRTSPAISTA